MKTDDSECLLPLEHELINGSNSAHAKAHEEHLETLRRGLTRALVAGAAPDDYVRLQAALNSVEAGIDILRSVQGTSDHKPR